MFPPHFTRTLKTLVPKFLLDPARQLSGRTIRFTGNFKSWAEAEAASFGYSAKDILNHTIEAVRRVKSGEASFERDGVAFQEVEDNSPISWALKRAADRCGRLHVIDFGGSLGSTYYQICPALGSLNHVKWAIVEQSAHVDAGNREFANAELSFHKTIEEACKIEEFDAFLLSGVLQYLPDPFQFLRSVLDRHIPAIILDRTPFMVGDRRRLTVQHVPKSIYPATYPSWFFSEPELLANMLNCYDKVAEWPALDKHHPEGGRAHYKGFLFELKKPS
jgi:putative methyltransferase (TIGR04325 family)